MGPAMERPRLQLPTERSIRLAAGLLMFTFATCHLVSHATGLFLLDAIQNVGHNILMAPWRTPNGLSLLLAAFLIHLGLGLTALYRRRHLRMPAIEAWQLGLGLTIPLLLAPHVSDARLGVLLYGLEDSYFRVLYSFWVVDPAVNLSRQLALLIAVWTHGCIGIHMWLRFRPWYQHHIRWFAGAAIGLPALAILGIINAGWDTVLRSAVVPGFAIAHGVAAPTQAAIALLALRLQIGYVALVVLVLAARAVRNASEQHRSGICIEYRAERRVRVPRGFSILEASRWANIPHASVCGGRARCTTCRVRVWRGLEGLPSPTHIEMEALKRIGASSGIRLACQVRPTADVAITPLLPVARALDGLRLDLNGGRETSITALHIDLRNSVQLATGRLPYDALFIIDRYIQETTAAILAHDGYVTSIAGDGIMSVFGVHTDAATAARQAIAAAAAIWRAIDQVSADLADDIGTPLQFGIGLHSGLAVVGAVGAPDRASLQFLGDTGNMAARLQGLTKELACVVIVSAATVAAAGRRTPRWRHVELDIRGSDAKLSAFLVDRHEDLSADGLSSTGTAAMPAATA
jgi:adenylate cyclase